ncbi:alcohol acetyltransferase [Lipomyces starkeyi]
MAKPELIFEHVNRGLRPKSDSKYELIRKAGPHETMFNLFHELGIQSNVLVAATYTHSDKRELTAPALFEALPVVINQHPALGIIGVDQPSQRKKGSHRLWEARLNTVNLRDCVEFVSRDGRDQGLQRIIEKSHNEWFDTKDRTRPLWKLVIVDNTHALFIYHHMIGDGLSGYAFHRSLLAALNEIEAQKIIDRMSVGNEGPMVNIPTTLPPAHSQTLFQANVSIIYIVYAYLWWIIIRLIFSSESFLFSDATFTKKYPTPSNPFPKDKRTVTRIESMKINCTTKEKCLVACRIHNTTLTAVLHTLIQVTLAADIYPKAKIGFSRVAVDMRRYMKDHTGVDIMLNAVGTFADAQWLGRYREAGRDLSIVGGIGDDSSPRAHADIALLWDLARRYRARLHEDIYESNAALKEYVAAKLVGEDIEEFASQGFHNIRLFTNYSLLVSNLGVFRQIRGEVSGGWNIKHVEFSAGATKASVGNAGIVFNVASAELGELVINASYEEGVLKPETVRKVMEGLEKRLKLLTE